MRYLAEVVGQIAVNNLVVPLIQKAMDAVHRVMGAPSRPVGVLLRLQVRFEDRLQHEQGRRLRHPVPYAGDAQWPEFAGLFLWDEDLPHRLSVCTSHPSVPAPVPQASAPTPYDSMSAKVSPSTPAEPPLRRTCLQASARKSSRHTLSISA